MAIRYLLIIFLLLSSGASYAQQQQSITSASSADDPVFSLVEQMPSPGYDILKYLAKNYATPKMH